MTIESQVQRPNHYTTEPPGWQTQSWSTISLLPGLDRVTSLMRPVPIPLGQATTFSLRPITRLQLKHGSAGGTRN